MHRLRWKHSIFAKLFLTMLGMALVIIVMMTVFMFFFVTPTIGAAVDRAASQNLELLASTDPDRATVLELARKLDLDVRFDGPNGSWATDEQLPRIADARQINQKWAKLHFFDRQYHIVTRPDGGAYLFSWRVYQSIRAAHDRLVGALVGCIAIVVLLAHAVLRAAIRPVEWLREGFARLSRGDLAVSVERRSNDEFGILTDDFNHMVEQVREMVTARDRLLLDVSHELRSPITRLKVALALLGDDEHKSHLLANVAEMETMVAQLLEIERLRGGRGLELDACDLAALVRESVQRFQERAPGVSLRAPTKAIPMRIDRGKIRTAIDNLLDNATKYSLPDSRPVEVTVAMHEHRVEIRIDDDGPGIPEPDRDRIFEPFFRVDRSRSRKTGGFGLGLSLCQRIVLAHRGSIQVSHRRPRGASFAVVLPISE